LLAISGQDEQATSVLGTGGVNDFLVNPATLSDLRPFISDT
jgi:hypothetical protein